MSKRIDGETSDADQSSAPSEVRLPSRRRVMGRLGMELDDMQARLLFQMNNQSPVDLPEGACPVIGAFVAFLVDGVPSAAEALDASAIAATALKPEVARRRDYACADFGVRKVAPAALRAANMRRLAKVAAKIDPITDRASANAAQEVWEDVIQPGLDEVTARRDEQAWRRLGYVPGESATYAAGRCVQAVFQELSMAGAVVGGAAAVVGGAIRDGVLAGAKDLGAEALAFVAELCMIDEPDVSSNPRSDTSSAGRFLGRETIILPQLGWWEWFRREGLKELFDELNPITDGLGTNYELRFLDYSFGEPKVDEDECRAQGLTYSASLRTTVRLTIRQTQETRETQVLLGYVAVPTDHAVFIVNGIERSMGVVRLNGIIDDPDDLAVGELLQAHCRAGMVRMARTIQERMPLYDADTMTAARLIKYRPLAGAVQAFVEGLPVVAPVKA